MTCKEIILDYLKTNNYDGLCNPDIDCGCGIDDFYTEKLIDCFISDCQPAYKRECKDCHIDNEDKYDYCYGNNQSHCYSIEKD